MPTSSIPAPLIPERAGIGSKQEVLDGYKGRRSYTSPFNLANTPALSINCGFTSEGLPVGLQIAGRPFDETRLFRVAYAYEQPQTGTRGDRRSRPGPECSSHLPVRGSLAGDSHLLIA